VDDHSRHFILDTELLRRDQFWFMDKDDRQASRLYPLTDFSPRKGEALEKAYLRARYGGVPFHFAGQSALNRCATISRSTARCARSSVVSHAARHLALGCPRY